MTAVGLAQLPVAAGGLLLQSVGRSVGWVVGLYMRAPLANTAAAALIGLTTMAGSNALYGQGQHHPAPFFTTPAQTVAATKADPEPVTPAVRVKQPVVVVPVETTASIPADVPAEPALGNAEVSEIQRRLQVLQLYDGEVDGLYGPQTARSIKAFEASKGLPETGMLTPEIYEAITGQKFAALVDAVVDPLPEADPLPEPTATALAAPEPLVLTAGDAIEEVTTVAMLDTTEAPVEVQRFVPDSKAVAPITLAELPPLEPQQAVMARAVVLEDSTAVAMTSDDVPELDTDAQPADVLPVSVTDPLVVARVQRGLSSLGFLYGPADGIAGEATAEAIRNFEKYFGLDVTGRITAQLPDLLVANGAAI